MTEYPDTTEVYEDAAGEWLATGYIARLENVLRQIRIEAEEQGGDFAPPAWCWVAELIDSVVDTGGKGG